MTALIAQAFSRQKDRLFLWLPVFMGIGIGLYIGLEAEPPVWIGAGGTILFSGLTVINRGHNAARIIFGLLLCVALGFGLAQLRTHIVATPILAKETGPRMIEGTITDIERLEPGKGDRVLLEDVIVERLPAEETPRKIRLRLRDGVEIKAGQRIRVLGSLMAPSPPVMPGAFDFQRYLYFQGIGATGFTFKNPEIIAENARGGFHILFEGARQVIARKTAEELHPAYAPFGIALLTGQQAAVSEADKQALRDSSMAHLLAISGMNIGMIYGAVFFLLRLAMAMFPTFTLHHPIKKYAAVAAFVSAALYTAIVGGDVPVMRALLMTGVITLAVLIDRSPFSPRLLAFAALVLLVWAPENLVNVSFQLSFAAVAALIFFFDATRGFWMAAYARAGITRRVFFYLASVLATTVIASAATTPFILYHFQSFPVYGVLANMIGVPLMGFVIMPAAVFAYLLMPLGLDGPAMAVMEWGIGWTMATAHWTAGLDGAVWHARALPFATFVLCVTGAIVATLWQGRGKWVGIGAIAAGLLIVPLTRAPDIIVTESFKLAALRDDSGHLTVSSGRAERFAAEKWMALNGEGTRKPPVWPREGRAEHSPLSCGPEGCRAEIKGQRVAFPRERAVLDEECRWAQIIISPVPLPENCTAGIALDLFDGYRDGAWALWLSPGSVTARSVRDDRGARPWTRYGGKIKEARVSDRSGRDLRGGPESAPGRR